MATIFKAPGRLEASDVRLLRIEFDRLAGLNDDVVVDMARTEAIDGSGVGALVYAFKRLAVQGKRLTVRNVSGQPLNLLNSAGLLRTLGGVSRESLLTTTIRKLRLDRIAAKPTRKPILATSAAPDTIFGPEVLQKPSHMPSVAAEQRTKGAA